VTSGQVRAGRLAFALGVALGLAGTAAGCGTPEGEEPGASESLGAGALGAGALGAPAFGVASERVRIETPDAPEAIGPYSQAIRVGNTLYLAGQIALDPATGAMIEGGITAETRRVMENLGAVLAAAGYSFSDVVQSQVFLVDLADFGAMNEVYATYFDDAPPARATVGVAALPRGARVEILMTAVR
jgi:2-iminobutanoate/2-iminopropanoate deaminase